MKKNYFLVIMIIFTFLNYHLIQAQAKLSKIIEVNTLDTISVKTSVALLKNVFHIDEDNITFIKERSNRDNLGFQVEQFSLKINGIPLDLNPIKVISKNDQVLRIVGKIPDIPKNLDASSLSKSDAFERAKSLIRAEKYLWEDEGLLGLHPEYIEPEGDLVYLFTDTLVLTYKFDIYAIKPLARKHVYINAVTGVTEMALDQICGNHVQGSGQSLYNGLVTFGAFDYNGLSNYRLHNTTLGGGVRTYDRFGAPGGVFDVTATNTPVFNNTAAVQAHWGAENVYNYFKQKHNRDSFDDQNGELTCIVGDFAYNGINAYWDGSKAVFGKGNGTTYNPIVSLDIVAHEFAHGVTGESAGLIYQNESGALNESFSDIFGVAVDYYATNTIDWNMGEDVSINNVAFRSLANPNFHADPDTYLGNYWATGPFDNGGVHTNSGVQNYWFYLLTAGGSGTNDNNNTYTVSGIGIEKAAAIAYRNLTTYLGPSSDHYDARYGAIQSAIDLYGVGSPEVIATTNAWYAVGVGSEYGTSSNCISADMTLRVTVDGRPENLGFLLRDQFGGYALSLNIGSLANQTPGSTVDYIVPVNVTSGDYMFIAYDQNGDGMTSNGINGHYELLDASGNVIFSKGTFYSSEAHQICIGSSNNLSYDLIPPSAPTNLSANILSPTSIDLNWGSSTDNTGVAGYYIVKEVNNVLDFTIVNGNGSSVPYNNLVYGVNNKISVIATDVFGNISPYSNTLNITPGATADTTPPSIPLNLQVNESQTSVALNWDDSTDNIGVTEYDIYSNGSIIGTSITSDFNAQGLTPNTNYFFKVRAKDAAGNISAYSVPVEALTLPSGCVGSLSIQINFDDHPEDINWILYNSNYSPEIFGNNALGYSGFQPYSTITESINISNLPDGDYVFSMFDRSGNGFAGGGSYQILGDGYIIHSGGVFDFSETTEICLRVSNGGGLDLTSPTAPTNLAYNNLTATTVDLNWTAATDNVSVLGYSVFNDNSYLFDVQGSSTSYQNFPVTSGQTYTIKLIARDPVGNFSGFSNEIIFTAPYQTDTLHEGFFETGWDNWIDGGNDCNRYNETNKGNNRSYEGSRSIRLRDNSGVNSSMTLQNIDLTAYNTVTLDFYVYIHSFENAEDFFVFYNDGSNWITVGNFVRTIDFTNSTYNKVEITLSQQDYSFPANAQFRIQSDASGNGDQIYVDQTRVIATTEALPTSSSIIQVGAPSIQSINNFNINIEENSIVDGDLKLYPNPSKDHFKIISNALEVDLVEIYSINGKLVRSFKAHQKEYDIQDLNSGMYFIRVYTEDDIETLKLIKN